MYFSTKPKLLNSINENFFKKWSSEMGYVLGFVVADGCIGAKRVRKRDGTKQYFFNITNKDRLHLENIQKALAARQKIYSKSSGYTDRKDYYFIQIGHQKICKDLINLGILPRKTSHLNPIKVPGEYFSDFVRGFFDGDGSVYVYEVNKTPQVKASFVSASFAFFVDFNRRLCQALNIPLKTIHQENPQEGKLIRYSICFYIDDCEKLAKFMYGNNPTLYLSRKHRIFERWKSIKRRHYIKQNYPSKVGWYLNQKVFVKNVKSP